MVNNEERFSGRLFANPRHFDVNYQINSYMKDEDIDTELAYNQWANIIKKMRKKTTVQIVNYDTFEPNSDPTSRLPDIVFCANQALSIPSNGYILANLKNDQRKAESEYFKMWARHRGYNVREIDEGIDFEGEGDAKWHPNRECLWVGHGYRTDIQAAREIDKMVDSRVRTLELTDEHFYHLDVCFEPITEEVVVIIKEAFSKTGIEKIRDQFSTIIEIPDNDVKTMGGNCSRIGSDSVMIDKRNGQTKELLEDHGFDVLQVDTGEYIKSGGSVDCLFVNIP